jgi:hypothetical protein
MEAFCFHIENPTSLGSIPGKDKRFSSSPECSHRLWDPQSRMCTGRGCFLGVKRPEREADASAELGM